MRFTAMLSRELDRFSEGMNYCPHKTVYYSFDRVAKLIDIVKETDQISGLAIVPYFLFNEQIMELYEYTLSIKVVNTVRKKELFFLEETGKNRIEEIDEKILKTLDMT